MEMWALNAIIFYNLVWFILCCLLFFSSEFKIVKIGSILIFCIFTYININFIYPQEIENVKEKIIAQEKLKDCEILRPNKGIIVYNCPEYTTTNVEVSEGTGTMSHTETYSTTINKTKR